MNGFFNINKPFGISSAKAVWLIKHKFGLTDKIGHMGTLDPNATGVLVVGVGRANRLFDVMQSKTKTYVAEFEFGYETETLDMESKVIVKKSQNIPTKEKILECLSLFTGKQSQVAPIFSAKNIDGRRAYELARQGKIADIKPHEIVVFRFELLAQKNSTTFQFEIECSSGTYIRSLCRDLAYKLSCVATMISLKRTKSGPFKIQDAKNIEDLSVDDLIRNDFALDHLKTIEFAPEDIKKIKNGLKISTQFADGNYKIYDKNCLVGIAKVENGTATIPTWLV